jgi:hypothetical protein
MSSDALPITPSRFATALTDLPVSALHLKVLELRNSIAHLDYSNEQLRPFAEGTATTTTPSQTQPPQQPQQQTSSSSSVGTGEAQTGDADCADAIRENEQVIERMQERIRLVRAEVERRGLSWSEFQSEAEREAEAAAAAAAAADGDEKTGIDTGMDTNGGGEVVNGVVNGAGAGGRHSAWTDGTFQTGVISGGVVSMDEVVGSRQGQGQAQGGSLTDEELRRRMEEQMRGLGGEDDDEGGLHL